MHVFYFFISMHTKNSSHNQLEFFLKRVFTGYADIGSVSSWDQNTGYCRKWLVLGSTVIKFLFEGQWEYFVDAPSEVYPFYL